MAAPTCSRPGLEGCLHLVVLGASLLMLVLLAAEWGCSHRMSAVVQRGRDAGRSAPRSPPEPTYSAYVEEAQRVYAVLEEADQVCPWDEEFGVLDRVQAKLATSSWGRSLIGALHRWGLLPMHNRQGLLEEMHRFMASGLVYPSGVGQAAALADRQDQGRQMLALGRRLYAYSPMLHGRALFEVLVMNGLLDEARALLAALQRSGRLPPQEVAMHREDLRARRSARSEGAEATALGQEGDSGPQLVPIPRGPASQLSVREFYRRFANTSTPVVITGLSGQLVGGHAWGLEFLRTHCGSVPYPVTVTSSLTKGWGGWSRKAFHLIRNLSDHIDRVAAVPAGPDVIFDASIPQRCPALLANFSVPQYFANDFLQRLPIDDASAAVPDADSGSAMR